MKIQKVNISFSSYTDADFENKAQHIVASMTGNPAFADPIPTLADVGNAIETYSADLVEAATLDRTAVAQKNKSRRELEMLLQQLGMYVMYIAKAMQPSLPAAALPSPKCRSQGTSATPAMLA